MKVLVSIMMSVSWSNKGKPLKLRHNDIRAHFQGRAQRRMYIRLPQRIVRSMANTKVSRRVKSMCGTPDASHIWQLEYVNLIGGELGGFRRGKHSAALFHNPNREQCTAMTLCVCQTIMDSNTAQGNCCVSSCGEWCRACLEPVLMVSSES